MIGKNKRILPVFVTLVVLLGILAACAPAAAPSQPTAAVPVTGGSTINVSETEYKLDMPATAKSGQVTFHVTNQGKIPHNLVVEGSGIEQKLPADIKPGQSADLMVNLQAGAYEVYCPVDGHKDLGMKVDLTVQ